MGKTKEEFPYRKFVIAGCITKEMIDEIHKILPEASLINTHNINQIAQVVEETLHENPVEVLTRNKKNKGEEKNV